VRYATLLQQLYGSANRLAAGPVCLGIPVPTLT